MSAGKAPFSARNRAPSPQIDNRLSETARWALLHVVFDFRESFNLPGWSQLAREFQRAAGHPPSIFRFGHEGEVQAREVVEEIARSAPWERVMDVVERLFHLLDLPAKFARDDDWSAGPDSPAELAAVRERFSADVERVFVTENLAFEFKSGSVVRRGRSTTLDRIDRANLVLGDERLSAARSHFNKAIRYFRDVRNPDLENAVKEAVCSVEAAAKSLFPKLGSDYDKLLKRLGGPTEDKLPQPIVDTISKLFGYRGSGNGVTHGGAAGGAVTREIAEYVLAVAASQVVLLADFARSQEQDIPF